MDVTTTDGAGGKNKKKRGDKQRKHAGRAKLLQLHPPRDKRVPPMAAVSDLSGSVFRICTEFSTLASSIAGSLALSDLMRLAPGGALRFTQKLATSN